jgi:hypothetical protein
MVGLDRRPDIGDSADCVYASRRTSSTAAIAIAIAM